MTRQRIRTFGTWCGLSAIMPLNLTTVYLRSLSKFNHQVTAFFKWYSRYWRSQCSHQMLTTSNFLLCTGVLFMEKVQCGTARAWNYLQWLTAKLPTFSFMLSTSKLNENPESCVLKKVWLSNVLKPGICVV